MKKFLVNALTIAILAMIYSCGSTQATAQSSYQEVKKLAKKELQAKATKDARKQAKQYRKEGWLVPPGALPLEKQLDRAYTMMYEVNDNYEPRYIWETAMSTGSVYDGARMQAQELAKQNLAGRIQTEITSMIENTVANSQLEDSEAATIAETVMASKNIISQSLGRTNVVVDVYRTLPNGNKEVLVQIFYDSEQTKQKARKVIKQDLESRGENLHGKLDQILGL